MNTLQQLLRFGVVGLASNTLLYLIYLGMTGIGVGPKLSMSLLYVIGVIKTFAFNRSWTFNHEGRLDSAFVRYVAVYAFGYLVNFIVLAWLVDGMGYPHQIVQGVMILTLAICMFVLQKFWVFKVAYV